MKFSKNQISKGIVVDFQDQQAIAKNAEEAISVINSFKSAHRNILGCEYLSCNPYAERYLTALFNGEEVSCDLKTTNCGKYGIKFYEALGATIEEHQAAYKAKCEEEKTERLRKAEEVKKRMLADFNEQKRGWYYVEVDAVALTPEVVRTRKKISGYTIADSKMDAYNKMAFNEAQDICIEHGLTFEGCSEWNSLNTTIQFLGMKTDFGYSVEAWEEYQKSLKSNEYERNQH